MQGAASSMKTDFTDTQLIAYLDEALPAETMSEIEQTLREHPKLIERLGQLCQAREAGVHSLGAIWRRQRISCPSRTQLGSFLLRALPQEWSDYVRFHIEEAGCRYCQASLEDLRSEQQESAAQVSTRRRKYFQSSAGYLKKP